MNLKVVSPYVDAEDLTMADKDIVTRIAGKIRAIRLKQGLTIRQLAEKANVSKGLLSKIENSRTIPSLPVFVQIIRSLDIPFMDFFADMGLGDEKNYILIRNHAPARAKAEHSDTGDKNIIMRIMPSPAIEMQLVTLKPGAGRESQLSRGYRFVHLVSGMCEYHARNEIIALRGADSIYFDARIRYQLFNPTDKEAIVFLVEFRSCAEQV